MKLVDKYIFSKIFTTFLVTLLITALFVVAIELFINIDNYINYNISVQNIAYIAFLSIQKFILMIISISFLFSVTYALSSLHANNEIIILYNCGINYKKIIFKIITFALIATLFVSFLNEKVFIKMGLEYDRLNSELFGRSSTTDNSNIRLSSADDTIVVQAAYFNSNSNELSNLTIIEREDSKLVKRVEARKAKWEHDRWMLYDATVIDLVSKEFTQFYENYNYYNFNIKPEYFKNNTLSITNMDIKNAISYLEDIKNIDIRYHNELKSEFYKRIFSPISIFVLIFIAALMNYNFKKNILTFAILQSLIIAVIYYVADMVGNVFAIQMVITPLEAILLPIILVLILLLILRLLGRKI